ncbi:MAG: phosphatidylglycerophosphatase A [Ignavibacteria bacterium]|nr:MAG: phosphatidylglycerophosphatase A [Ignavibacteria bacterium]
MEDTSARQDRADRGAVSFPIRLLATGLFSGYSPIAPGTAGSMLGVAIYLIPGFEAGAVLAVAIIVTFLLGVYVSAQMENDLGEDPPVVVIDEVVGMWISLFLLPKTVWVVSLSFLLFRAFDIFKPPPARRLERNKNGWGIMLDDVAAGVYANVAARLVLLLFR